MQALCYGLSKSTLLFIAFLLLKTKKSLKHFFLSEKVFQGRKMFHSWYHLDLFGHHWPNLSQYTRATLVDCVAVTGAPVTHLPELLPLICSAPRPSSIHRFLSVFTFVGLSERNSRMYSSLLRVLVSRSFQLLESYYTGSFILCQLENDFLFKRKSILPLPLALVQSPTFDPHRLHQ